MKQIPQATGEIGGWNAITEVIHELLCIVAFKITGNELFLKKAMLMDNI